MDAFLKPPEPSNPSSQSDDAIELTPVGAADSIRYFGDYELIEEIARGGMGVVYLARQRSLARLVALKLIRAGYWAHPDQRERFRREAQAAASLQHPNIVAIHEIGEHRGQPYFSMDFIDGQNLAQTMKGVPQTPERAVRWMRGIAKAMHYAHQRGVIHRDLKPSNILLDADERPHIADFGLAKFDASASAPPSNSSATASVPRRTPEGRAGSVTLDGTVLGSPDYMAPEQAAGRGEQVGVPADIWALGAILYEMLTGRPPFRTGTAADTIRLVREVDPIAPRRLNPSLPRDLETICLKCLEKSVERRYATAEALAEELDRYERHEPIQARPIGAPEKFAKWLRRHPARAAFITGTFLAILAYGLQFLGSRAHLRQERYAADIHFAAAAIDRGQVAKGSETLVRLREETRLPWEPRLLGFEWYYWAGRLTDALGVLSATNNVRELQFSAEGGRLSAGLESGGVMAWQRPTMGLALDWSALGRTLITIRRDATEERRRALISQMRLEENPALVTAGAENSVFATVSPGSRKILLWLQPTSDARARVFAECWGTGPRFTALAFSPDDSFLASGNADGLVQLWNASPGPQASQALAALGTNRMEREWRQRRVPRAGDLMATFRGHRGPVSALSFAPDGELLASASVDGTVRFWTGRPPVQGEFRPDVAPPLAFSSDSRWLHARSSDGQALVLDARTLAPAEPNATPAAPQPAHSEALRWIFRADRALEIRDAESHQVLGQFVGHTAEITAATLSPDGLTVVSGDREGTVKFWHRATGRELYEREVHSEVRALAFAPDGQLLVAADAAGLLWYWRAARTDSNAATKLPEP